LPHQPWILVITAERSPPQPPVPKMIDSTMFESSMLKKTMGTHEFGPDRLHHFSLDIESLRHDGKTSVDKSADHEDYHVSGKITIDGGMPNEYDASNLLALFAIDVAHHLPAKAKKELLLELHKMIEKVEKIPLDEAKPELLAEALD